MSPGLGLQRTLLPQGFFASGVNCGIRRYRPDLGLIFSEVDCVAVGVYTTNQFKAAPLLYCQNLLPSKKIRAIVTNSGQANAATGELGQKHNDEMAQAVAKNLNVEMSQVLTASTGVIGKHMEIEKIVSAVPELVERASDVAEGFALAILTTDLVPKTCTSVVKLSGGEIRMTGICKGSGMIHPNMGTMLGYMVTDLAIDCDLAQTLLREATDVSYNMISVDGESSTNDCSFLMANGLSGVQLKTQGDIDSFRTALINMSQFLAQAIAADGEGATKLIEVDLKGAPTLEMARKAARGVILSPLVKTAMHGEDPNWGRVLARLGADQVPAECMQKMTLRFQGHTLFEKGQPQNFDFELVRGLLKKNRVQIEIDLDSGPNAATAWGCDLSNRYISINTEYT